MPADQVGLDVDDALDVARAAARLAIDILASTPLGSIRTKADAADVVTDVDTATERAVRALIADRLPGHVVVGEEYGGTAVDGPTWYCDPVDGTTNLAAGLPWTSFSLGLTLHGKPVLGVVADPWRDEVLEAVVGRGTRRNGEPLPRAAGGTLAGGVVLTEWARHVPWPGMLTFLAGLADRLCTARIMGSSTLTLAHVAAGRAVGAVVGTFQPEDHLAAAVIAAEAGYAVWDENGDQQPFPRSGGIMIARPAVAAELFDLWRGAIAAER
jgi:myo-inositol-1(or 4)-monophosphatase